MATRRPIADWGGLDSLLIDEIAPLFSFEITNYIDSVD